MHLGQRNAWLRHFNWGQYTIPEDQQLLIYCEGLGRDVSYFSCGKSLHVDDANTACQGFADIFHNN